MECDSRGKENRNNEIQCVGDEDAVVTVGPVYQAGVSLRLASLNRKSARRPVPAIKHLSSEGAVTWEVIDDQHHAVAVLRSEEFGPLRVSVCGTRNLETEQESPKPRVR